MPQSSGKVSFWLLQETIDMKNNRKKFSEGHGKTFSWKKII